MTCRRLLNPPAITTRNCRPSAEPRQPTAAPAGISLGGALFRKPPEDAPPKFYRHPQLPQFAALTPSRILRSNLSILAPPAPPNGSFTPSSRPSRGATIVGTNAPCRIPRATPKQYALTRTPTTPSPECTLGGTGILTASGLYTAPACIGSHQSVTVTTASQSGPTRFASAPNHSSLPPSGSAVRCWFPAWFQRSLVNEQFSGNGVLTGNPGWPAPRPPTSMKNRRPAPSLASEASHTTPAPAPGSRLPTPGPCSSRDW